jgi:hypothetical protein
MRELCQSIVTTKDTPYLERRKDMWIGNFFRKWSLGIRLFEPLAKAEEAVL